MEHVLMALMPLSISAAIAALRFGGLATAAYTAAFYWAWAVKNVVVGPISKDAGVLTFALYLAAALFKWRPHVQAGVAFLLMANYAIPFFSLVMVPRAKMAKKMRKSVLWMHVFVSYTGVGAWYWACVGILHWRS